MRTYWSVFVLLAGLLAGCQTATAPATWEWEPVGETLLAVKDETGAKAATRPARPAKLTVKQAVDEALNANRVVRQARLAAAIALATEHEARAGLRPTVIFSGGWSKRDKPPLAVTQIGSFSTGPREQANYRIGLDFPIFAFGEYFYGYKAARYARFGAEAESAAAEADIAAAVTAAAFDLLLSKRAVDVAESNREALERQVKDAQSLLDAGRVTKSALLEAQVQYDRAERDRDRLVSAIPIKRLVLNQLLGRPSRAKTEIVDDPVTRQPGFLLDRLLNEAQQHRPELRAARMRVESAMRGYKAARGAALPELRGSLSYQGTNSQFTSPSDWGTFALTLDVPLYVGGANYARIRRSEHEIEVSRLALADLEQQIYTEVATAFRDVQETYRDIAVAERSITRSEENLRIQREKFNSGRATSQEVLESTTLLSQSRFDYISALYSYNNALSELHRVRGGDPRIAPAVEAAPEGSKEE
jgi:outer membrane protein